jgi:hypothetical protein
MALAPRLFWLNDQEDIQGGSDPLKVHQPLAEQLVNPAASVRCAQKAQDGLGFQ